MKKLLLIMGLLIIVAYTERSLTMEPLNRRLPTYEEMIRNRVASAKASNRIQKINDIRETEGLPLLTFDEEMEIFEEMMQNNDYDCEKQVG